MLWLAQLEYAWPADYENLTPRILPECAVETAEIDGFTCLYLLQ